jgi:hypothetical protein
VLLLATSAVSGTPSAKIKLRALELMPHTRVAIVAWVSPLFRFLRKTLGRYFTASSTSTRFTVCSILRAVTRAMAGSVRFCIAATAGSAGAAMIFTSPSLTAVSGRVGGVPCASSVPCADRIATTPKRRITLLVGIDMVG